MGMLTAEAIKKYAMDCGADLVSIGTPDRFEGTDPKSDPRCIAPHAKSVICMGFRVLRGSLRGNVEGTQFFQYPEMSVVHLDEVYIPMVLRKVVCRIEDEGYEAVPLRSEPDRRHSDDPDTNPEKHPVARIHAVSVREGTPPPDVMIDFNQGAVLCGMGEMGLGGFVLTVQYGPLQRFAFILTDIELASDPILERSLCDDCGKCFQACPGKAYSNGMERVFHYPDGKEGTKFLVPDSWQCAAFYMGADYGSNPFVNPEDLMKLPDGKRILEGTKQFDADSIEALQEVLEDAYPGMRFGYNAAICGRACWRACLGHLEERGVLERSYKHPLVRLSRGVE